MGMDVYGCNPSAPQGRHFRRSVWGWRPLAELVCQIAPDETDVCTMWHTNDGDGLNDGQAVLLADRLQALVDDGAIAKYVKQRDDRLAALPNLQCRSCEGTGIRTDDRALELGQHLRIIGPDTGADISHPRFGQSGWCNGCDGVGRVRSSETHYRVEAGDVIEFVAFLRACGGFEIC